MSKSQTGTWKGEEEARRRAVAGTLGRRAGSSEEVKAGQAGVLKASSGPLFWWRCLSQGKCLELL